MSSVQLDNLVRPGDMISCQLDSSPSQGRIIPAPDLGRRHGDLAERRFRENGIPRYQFSAPVSAPGSLIAAAVAIDKLVWQAAVPQ